MLAKNHIKRTPGVGPVLLGFRQEIDPGIPLDRRGLPGTSICTKNQPRRPILRPLRDTQLLPPDCLQVPSSTMSTRVRQRMRFKGVSGSEALLFLEHLWLVLGRSWFQTAPLGHFAPQTDVQNQFRRWRKQKMLCNTRADKPKTPSEPHPRPYQSTPDERRAQQEGPPAAATSL